MKSTLYLKFALIYIIFGFLSIFMVGTLTSQLTQNRIESSTTEEMYKEATLMTSSYLTHYYSDEINLHQVYLQLQGMSSNLNANVWFTDSHGKIQTSAVLSTDSAPAQIDDFDPNENGARHYTLGNYHGYFSQDMITVIVPVTHGLATRGYLILHKPAADIESQQKNLIQDVYLTVVIIYLLSFSILLAFQLMVYRPLRKITEAATQYASGNLDYAIPVRTQDEIGYLSASLNYMSTQIRDMEDYQKKFIANVSHDFRSPLTSIKGYAQAMADGTIPYEMQEKYLRIILFETERLTDLTKDLLALNELDTKELLLDKSPFDLHEAIRNTCASLEGRCTEKHITFELLLEQPVLIVYADKRKIQQVIYNLLDNAIKFSETDSDITIETTRKGEKIFVSIKDHGLGIPKDSITKVWDRFYKTDLSRGKDKKGTGLGLAIVKEIINAHGENINVVSTEGVGSEFIFSLSEKAGKSKG